MLAIEGDAAEFLAFVRNRFPSYTSHDIQHSWRIVQRIESILTSSAKDDLSSVEIFAFIVAAAFHDVGMTSMKGEPESVRKTHHELSGAFVQDYMASRLSIMSEECPRLSRDIAFIIKSHGINWDEMAASETFRRHQKLFGQQIRCNILAIFLRVGDLLDLDSERSCDALRRQAASFFEDEHSSIHHDRHKRVESFNYDIDEIRVTAIAKSKEEHSIWTEWLAYLKQDILNANTFVFKGELSRFRLPEPILDVQRAAGAKYSLWAIKFELDSTGRLFDVISKSIYVGRFDFIRELLQNAIDAGLSVIFSDQLSTVGGNIPRLWSLDGYSPVALVLSIGGNAIEVRDNGVGMNNEQLRGFLFRVAETGFGNYNPKNREIKFPAIAKFGIGFVSCLIRATRVTIDTLRRGGAAAEGIRVVLNTQALDAYTEEQPTSPGTTLSIQLKDNLSGDDIGNYISENILYPSVPIYYFDLMRIAELHSLAKRFSIPVPELRWDPIEGEQLSSLLQKNLDACQSITSEITNNFSDLVPANTRRDLYSSYFKVSPRSVVGEYPDKPYFIWLDTEFNVRRVTHTVSRELRDEFPTFTVWIPVRILDENLGLDWFSMHGFLVSADAVRRVVTSFRALSEEFDNDDLTETYADDELDNWDEDAGLFQKDDYAVDLVDLMRRRRKSFRSVQPAVKDRDYRLTLEPDRIGMLDEYGDTVGLFDHFDEAEDIQRVPSHRKQDLDTLVEEAGFVHWFEQFENQVFQDGIRQPLAGWLLAPIGACRSVCNLTGNARFDLNASRNQINESPSLLRIWAKQTGTKIQESVLRSVTMFFLHHGVSFELSELFSTNDKKYGALVEYTGTLLEQPEKSRPN